MFLHSAEPRPSASKKLRYTPLCGANEESSSDMLSEELVIDSVVHINLEIEGEIVSEELGNKMSESKGESETNVACSWVGRLDNGRQDT